MQDMFSKQYYLTLINKRSDIISTIAVARINNKRKSKTKQYKPRQKKELTLQEKILTLPPDECKAMLKQMGLLK